MDLDSQADLCTIAHKQDASIKWAHGASSEQVVLQKAAAWVHEPDVGVASDSLHGGVQRTARRMAIY